MSGHGARGWAAPLIDAQIISDAGGFVQADATVTKTPDKLALRDGSADSAFATVTVDAIAFPETPQAIIAQDDKTSGAGVNMRFKAQDGFGATEPGGFEFFYGADLALSIAKGVGASQVILANATAFPVLLLNNVVTSGITELRTSNAAARIHFSTRQVKFFDNVLSQFGALNGDSASLDCYLTLGKGSSAVVSPADQGSIAYDEIAQQWTMSEDQGAHQAFAPNSVNSVLTTLEFM